MRFSVRFFPFLFLLFFNPLHATPKQYPCFVFRLQVLDMPRGEVAFINGVNHKPQRAVKCASLLSSLSGGYNVYVVYNPTCGILEDLKKSYLELYKYRVTPPVQKLHEKWNTFFEGARSWERYLQFCHSQGAIQVRNALLSYPEHLRKRMIIVAIAPAAYIPEQICYQAYHYVSRRDIVPWLDRYGMKKCMGSICILTPHQDAAFFDHHFLSPTYRAAIQHHLKCYIQSGGRFGD
jgi:hypothetical protein